MTDSMIEPWRDEIVVGYTTLQFHVGGLLGEPTDRRVHLVRRTERGTPGPTLCGIDRFAKDSAGWSVGGGYSSVTEPCPGCDAARVRGASIDGMAADAFCVDCPDTKVVDCPHSGHRAEVDVIFLEDVGAWTADVRISCDACGEKFRFVGVQPGLSGAGPRRSIEGTELHVPIRPVSQSDEPTGMMGYTVQISDGPGSRNVRRVRRRVRRWARARVRGGPAP